MWRGLSWFNSLYLYCLACILSYITAEVIKTLVKFSTLSTELLSLHALSEFGMTHSSLFPNLHGNTVWCSARSCDHENIKWKCRENVATHDKAL